MMLLLALTLPWPVVGYVLITVGVLGFLLIPVITDRIIERREVAIAGVTTPEGARRQIEWLDGSVLVSAFAPDAWVTLQRGRLHLALGDGQAAAQDFADTARILQQPDMPVLLGARARALMLADARSAARHSLETLQQADALDDRDRMWLGVVMLDEAARADAAREHLEAAYAGLGGHPQASAALAIALARTDDPDAIDRAMTLLADAEAGIHPDDVLGHGLIKRARKALRPAKKRRKKKR